MYIRITQVWRIRQAHRDCRSFCPWPTLTDIQTDMQLRYVCTCSQRPMVPQCSFCGVAWQTLRNMEKSTPVGMGYGRPWIDQWRPMADIVISSQNWQNRCTHRLAASQACLLITEAPRQPPPLGTSTGAAKAATCRAAHCHSIFEQLTQNSHSAGKRATASNQLRMCNSTGDMSCSCLLESQLQLRCPPSGSVEQSSLGLS